MINLYLLGKKGLVSIQALKKPEIALITTVVIGQDPNVQNDYADAIEEWCAMNSVDYVIQNKTLYNNAHFNIAIGWRWLIRNVPNLIIFHDSILPKYRGFNPLVTALINGDRELGVTALWATESYDSGEIIEQRTSKVSYPIKISDAIELVASLYAKLLREIIKHINTNNINSKPQNEKLVSYSIWRDKKDYQIDWNKDAHYIQRFIHALGFPYEGAFTKLQDKILRIFDAEVIKDVVITNRQPGKVIFKDDNGLTIICGEGLLKIKAFYDLNGNIATFEKFRLRFE